MASRNNKKEHVEYEVSRAIIQKLYKQAVFQNEEKKAQMYCLLDEGSLGTTMALQEDDFSVQKLVHAKSYWAVGHDDSEDDDDSEGDDDSEDDDESEDDDDSESDDDSEGDDDSESEEENVYLLFNQRCA